MSRLLQLSAVFLIGVYALDAQVPPAQRVAIPIQFQIDRTGDTYRAVLLWRHDTEYVDSYTVLYRNRTTDPQFWVAGTVAPGTDSIVTYELPLESGTTTEIGVLNRLVRTINNQQVQFTAAGYACIALEQPIQPFRGRVLLVIDSSIAEPLANELAQLEADLDREGWRTSRTIVPRAEQFNAAAVQRTKDSIRSWYQRGPLDEPATAFLIGRVAVPYSGLYYQGQYIPPPDGHNPDHRGAWPCDGYYGTLSESGWTDAVFDTAGVVRPENRNVPGDGKFDNVLFPSPVAIRIGRVDFYNLPRLTPPGTTDRQSERALLQDYFARNHAYRTGATVYTPAALIDDNFKSYTELFARSGWISFPPIVGIDRVREEKWFPTLDTASRLFAYGCGTGSYTSAGGIGTVADFASRTVRAAFTMLFGSYFGDWDSQNNLMRVNLGRGALTCAWSGRPIWYLHPMAAGETIGDITLMVQNFSPFGQSVYVSSTAQGWIHVALLGDPTLRVRFAQQVSPPRTLSLQQNGRVLQIRWEPPPMPSDSIVGYYVYRTLPNGREQALTLEPITTTEFTDNVRVEGTVRYAVRTVGRVRTPSGIIWELSPATRAEVTTTGIESEAAQFPVLQLEVSPNPAEGELRVTARVDAPLPVRIEVRSLDGRTVATLFEGNAEAPITAVWHPADRAAGVYMVVATARGVTACKPVVLVR
jgi:hypothetical protein